MKFFIYLCCLAYLLTEISAKLKRTTPMSSALRSNNDVTRQVQKIGDMIEFINSFDNYNGRKLARRGGSRRLGSKHQVGRRFELPKSTVKNLPPSVIPNADEDIDTQMKKISETERDLVIDNPEVLKKFRNKLKKKKNDELIFSKPTALIIDTQSALAKSFSTVDEKLKYYHKNAKYGAETRNKSDTLNLKLTQDTKNPKNVDIELKITENYNSKARTDEQNHVVPEKRYKRNKFGKKTDVKARANKNKAYVDKNKALIEDSSNNRTENEEIVDNKNIRADSANSKDNESNKTDVEKEKGKKPKQKSKNKKKRKPKFPETLSSRTHKKKTNRQDKEKLSIFSDDETKENSHRDPKKEFEKIDNDDIEVKKDKKRKLKRSTKKEKEVSEIDDQKYAKENGYDTMEIEWNKRHLEYDKKEKAEKAGKKESSEEEWKEDYDFVKRNSNGDKNREYWDRNLHKQQDTDSDLEKEDRWYLRHERDKIY